MATIAVVDDEPGLLQFCVRLLEERGHSIVAAKDGQDALEAIVAAERAGNTPELVISDVQMPRLDGIGLCRMLRERFDRAQLPIVLVSVLDAEDDILRAFESGANDYITKPYRAGVLLAKVSLLLRERELLAPVAPWAASPKPPTPLEVDREPPLKEDAPTQRVSSDDTARPMVPVQPPEPPFLFDRYEVERVIGRGGMSIVYCARDREGGRPVALKLLSPHVAQDRHGLARFLREVAVLKRIESDRIVHPLDSGMDCGIYFLAMELVEGVSAKTRLHERGPFEPARAAAVVRDVALALAALAEKGLVHRDVKPSNFIITHDGRATLVDFGLARSQDVRDLTESGEAVGTPHYLAPEVVQGEAADSRADLYSLGVSLFELLAGKKPYTGRTCFELFHKAIAGPPAELARERAELPPAILEVVSGLMQRDPTKRLQPAETVADMLDLLAGDGAAGLVPR